MEKLTVGITGMSCAHCVKAATEALSELNGVTNVLVSLEDNNATLEYDTALVAIADINAAITEAGFAPA